MPRPRKTPAEIRAMRERILDGAYAILQEGGHEALTSRAIAERLGMAHMSLFTYFENMAAIVAALRDREMQKWLGQLDRIGQNVQSRDIHDVVRELLQFYVGFARQNPSLYRLAWVMPESGIESVEQNRRRMQTNVSRLAEILHTGMENGEFVRRDPLLAAIVVLGMVNMPHILFHSGKLSDPIMRDRAAEETILAALGYLKTPTGTGEL